MKIIFIGGVFRDERKDEIIKKSKTMPYFAADTHQWGIIKGLDFHSKQGVKIINAVHLASFPKYKDIFIKSSEWSHNGISQDKDLGFINIFGIKHIWRSIVLIKEVRKAIVKEVDSDIVLLSYGLHVPFLISAFLSKKVKNKNIKWCCIIPEIPLFYIGQKGQGKLYNFLKLLDWKLTLKLLNKADMFQLLTKQMADLLKIEDKKHIVIEGIVNINNENSPLKNNNDNDEEQYKTILYTGTTNIEFGIVSLLEAFKDIKKPNYRLIICGSGNGNEIISDYMKSDSRITWRGFIPRDEVLKLQKNVTLLINPRSAGEDFVPYSFPSKTMEYLQSGTPVLMHRLPGIPFDYGKYILWFKSENPKIMAEQIVEICEWDKDKRKQFGNFAKEFVLQNKNELSQGKKLFDMLASEIN
ncbi:glycosyltransferase [Cytobacillus oceanisediminis]|uniref:glycosyltransferase n=1 Tax=Cytobacillus oceanisediminis TaxID=665099 RepID=UPI003735C45A